MMLESILWSTVGGGVIGLSASWLLLAKGRIAGVSGILGGLLGPWDHEAYWRVSFVAGLIAGGGLLMWTLPSAVAAPEGRPLALLALAGLAVGYGTRLGSGCTSGHGVCGLSRLSPRSFVATLTFLGAGAVSATLMAWLGGAA